MGWFTGCVLYALIWWVVLFAVLPVGASPVADGDPVSGWRGAPTRPRLGRKAIVTSIIAAIIWFGCYIVISHEDWLSFRHGWLALHDK